MNETNKIPLKDNYSTISTFSSINSNKVSEFEKIKREKTKIEENLVKYKYKFAENSSRIMELEDLNSLLNNKIEELTKNISFISDTLKIKEDIIKSLIEDRDNFKYKKQSNNVSYIDNNLNKSIINDNIFSNDIKNKSPNTSRRIDLTINTNREKQYEKVSPSQSKGIISKLVKNIFK
jgi:hypothetical protein